MQESPLSRTQGEWEGKESLYKEISFTFYAIVECIPYYPIMLGPIRLRI